MKNPLIVLGAFVVALICAGVPLAQQKAAVPTPAPTAPAAAVPQAPPPDTALRVSLQSLEQKKSDASKAWGDAMQQELTIEREWSLAHPGWHIDQDALQSGSLHFLPDEKPPATPAKK